MCTGNTHILQASLQLSLGIVDLIDSFRELEVDSDPLVVDVLSGLLQDAIDNASESAGGIALLLGLQNVLIGERTPLVRSDGAGRGKKGEVNAFYPCSGLVPLCMGRKLVCNVAQVYLNCEVSVNKQFGKQRCFRIGFLSSLPFSGMTGLLHNCLAPCQDLASP